MIRIIIFTVGVLMMCLTAKAQHMSHEPSFLANDMIWNPGSTAERDYLEYSVFYRNQWTGFNNAPRTLMIHAEYPFLYNNFSVGGYLYNDQSGIVDFVKAGLNYAYKLKLGIRRSDQLSIGVSANISKFRLNRNRIISTNNNDPNLSVLTNSGLKPDVDFGIHYISDSRTNQDRSYFFVGLSANSLIQGLDFINAESGSLDFERTFGANAMIGINQYVNSGSIMAYSWLSYSENNSYRVGVNTSFLYDDTFSFGLLGATDGSIGLKLGTNINNDFLGDGFIKLEVAAYSNVKISSLVSNPTYEVYVAYSFRTR